MQSSLYISKRHRHNWVRAWPAPWGECELGCTSAIGRYDRCNGTAGGRAVRILLCPPPFVFYSAELRGVPINPTHAHWGQVGTSVKWSIPVTFPNQSQVTQSQSPTTNHLSAQAHLCSLQRLHWRSCATVGQGSFRPNADANESGAKSVRLKRKTNKPNQINQQLQSWRPMRAS